MAKTKKQKKADKELLLKIHDRFKVMLEADQDNRRDAIEDMKFINEPGSQWDESLKKERGNRPCYEFNKLRVTAKRIINDIRANRPAGKVRGVEGGDKDSAELVEGLIRNIWNVSDGDTVIDYATEYQVSGGMGAWRVVTDYATDNAFDQDISIEAIPNPYCLFADPSSRDHLKRDARDWILTEKISTDAYESKYPNAEVCDFEEHEFDDEEWNTDEETRIAEYWWKEPIDKEIWQLQDGKVIDSEEDEALSIAQYTPELIKNRRTVKTHKIMMCIASGDAILEGPTEWAGRQHPFIVVYGEHMIIDGKKVWYGIGRFAKDAQRSYNISRTAITETIAMAPQAKFWATPEQAMGHTDKWAEAHKKNYPFLMYNADPKAPGPPSRMGGADVPVALIQESQLASEEIKAVTGIFSADMGAVNSASSGRQEIARQQQGELATFNYQDNLSKGIRRTWEILIDLIPEIYDTERELRILGSDGAEDYQRINTFTPGPNGEMIKVNDLSKGRYDVTVTIGPNWSTRRQEAAETYQHLLQGNPQIFPLAGDLIFKSMDLPYAEDIADRLKMMLPPEIQQMVNGDKPIPPEVQGMMQQAQQAMAQVQEQAQMIQQQAQESEMAKSEIEKLMAQLDKEKAQFDAHVAKELAKVSQKDLAVTMKSIEGDRENYVTQNMDEISQVREVTKNELAQQVNNSVAAIQNMASQFEEYAGTVLTEIQRRAEEKPKIIRIDAVRKDGKLSAVPVYENELAS